MTLILTAALLTTPVTADDCPLCEIEWVDAWVEHTNSPPVDTHLHLPVQFAGMGANVERWRGLVETYFPTDQVEHALEIMACESGGNPGALNQEGSSARGLFQILASLWAPNFGVSYDDLYDPELNVALARQVYDRQGWSAWACH